MAHIVTLKDNNDEISYPITPVDAVFVDNNTTLSEALDDKADADLTNINAGSVTTSKIANNAVTADKIDFTTFESYTDSESNFSIPTSSESRLSVTISTPGKYLLLFNMSSQSQTSNYSLYSDFYISGSSYNTNYVTVPGGCWGNLSNIYVADINTANTQVNLRLRCTSLIAASTNTKGTLVAIRIG